MFQNENGIENENMFLNVYVKRQFRVPSDVTWLAM
jgi:hypothetical protein